MEKRTSYRDPPRLDGAPSRPNPDGFSRHPLASRSRTQRVSYARKLQLPLNADDAFDLFLPGIFPHTLEPSGTKVPEASLYPLPYNHAEARRSVFRTEDVDGGTNVWLPMGYDAAKRSITYLRVTPGARLGVVEVSCVPQTEELTAANVRFTFTQVTDDGAPPARPFTEDQYDEMVRMWKSRIDEMLHQRAAHLRGVNEG